MIKSEICRPFFFILPSCGSQCRSSRSKESLLKFWAWVLHSMLFPPSRTVNRVGSNINSCMNLMVSMLLACFFLLLFFWELDREGSKEGVGRKGERNRDILHPLVHSLNDQNVWCLVRPKAGVRRFFWFLLWMSWASCCFLKCFSREMGWKWSSSCLLLHSEREQTVVQVLEVLGSSYWNNGWKICLFFSLT